MSAADATNPKKWFISIVFEDFMKIVSFEKFAAMGEGVIYSYYERSLCTGLYRKGPTIYKTGDGNREPIDFFECTLVPECWNGDEPTIDDTVCRWGLFDYSMQFAVFEETDLDVLRTLIG